MNIIDYNSIKIGEIFYSKFQFSESDIEKFIDVVEDKYEALPDKNKTIPNYAFSLYKPIHEAIGKVQQGTIHIEQKMHYFSSAKINDTIKVRVLVKNKYKLKNKDFLVLEVDFINNSRIVCRHETVHIWAFANGGN